MSLKRTLPCLHRAFTLDGALGERELKKRALFFVLSVSAFVLTVAAMISGHNRERTVYFVAAVLTICTCLGTVVILLSTKRPLTTRVEVCLIYCFCGCVFLWDLEARTLSQSTWPLLVLAIDLLLVMQVPTVFTVGLVVFTCVWMFVMGVEQGFRFGLFDIPGLNPVEGRIEYFRKMSDCVAPPCKMGFPPATLMPSVAVFVVDFLATRGFARDVLQEQATMQSTIRTVQEIASLLAGYDVEGVGRLLAMRGAELPEEMHGTLQTLEANLRRYRPYLPAALFEEAEMDGGDVQHTTVPPPGLTTGSAAIVFTDIRASTSIWENAPEGMRAGLQIHNAVMRDVMRMCGGYEVKTIGDAFMVAFAATADGVNFALRVHERLFAADWPAALLEDAPICAPQGDIWGGLTVRIGVNSGAITLEQNPLTGRTDYFGPTVNLASRLESTCTPGAVALPYDLWTTDCGACNAAVGCTVPTELKGISGTTDVLSIWPVSLAGRELSPVREDSGGWHTTSDVLDFDNSGTLSFTASHSARQAHATVAVAELRVDDTDAAALHDMNTDLATLTAALDRSCGSLVTLLGSRVCLAWNVTRSAPAHMENAIRFAQTTSLRGAGLASGVVHHGDVGARRQRFVTVMGATVRRSWTLCEQAWGSDGVCLFQLPEGSRCPSSLEHVLVLQKESGVYQVLKE